MDNRAAKIANARKKLRDHQEKKAVCTQKDNISETLSSCETPVSNNGRDHSIIANYEDHLIDFHKNEISADNGGIKIEQYNYHSDNHDVPVITEEKRYANVTEILISNKTNLEIQNKELQSKISQLENILSREVDEHNFNKQKLSAFEFELHEAHRKCSALVESVSIQDTLINELRNQLKSLTDDNNNLIEQQEFLKTMLTAKDMEVAQLNSQVCALQNQVDATVLQLQQLTNNSGIKLSQETSSNEQMELLKEKVAQLEHQLDCSLKEKDQINSHYEHYVSRLNEQLRVQAAKNEALSVEVKSHYNRENALIEQIGQMEIRMQHFRQQSEAYAESYNNSYIQELKDKVAALEQVPAPTPSKLKHNSQELLHSRNRCGGGTDPVELGKVLPPLI